MKRLSTLILFVTAALGIQAVPAVGQVSGRVVDSLGRPLPAATVELWRGDERIAARPTDSDGSFRFDGPEATGVFRVSSHGLGYSPAQQVVAAPATNVLLELVPAAVAIEGLTVAARPKVRCPQREDHHARDLWRSLAARYDHTRDTLGISFYARRYEGTGPFQEIGIVDESRLGGSWYGVKGTFRHASEYSTSPYPYGYPIHDSFDAAYSGWMYRELHATQVDHFLEESFGAKHTFSVLARREDSVVLGFCPTRRSWKGPSIEGTLTIANDTSFASAEWTFRTPRPAEEAGGEVVFVPRGGELIPLLPAQSLFWRKIQGRRDSYFQRWEQFATYEFLPPDVMPVQPRGWLSRP